MGRHWKVPHTLVLLYGIPYGRWFRFIWPLMLQLFIAGSIALVIAVLIGYH